MLQWNYHREDVPMAMEVFDHTRSAWSVTAEKWLAQALDDVWSGHDAVPAAEAAVAALRAECGEQAPETDLLAND